MACSGRATGIPFPSSQILKSTGVPEVFMATTAMLSSVFRKAVAFRLSLFDEHRMRRAPGRMNFEKPPEVVKRIHEDHFPGVRVPDDRA